MSGEAPKNPSSTGFGPNEWLVDEIYQQYLNNKNSVDPSWWEFFGDYSPTERNAAKIANEAKNSTPVVEPIARKPVEERIKNNQIVVLEIDLQGARQVKKSMPEAFLVMLKPPSIEELKRRLIDRGTEKPEELELRLQVAIGELEAENEFDAVVINEDVQSAVSQLITLLHLN